MADTNGLQISSRLSDERTRRQDNARRNIQTSDDVHDRKTGDIGGRADSRRVNLFLLGTSRNLSVQIPGPHCHSL